MRFQGLGFGMELGALSGGFRHAHRDVCILHEHHEVDKELPPPPQYDVRLAAILLKPAVVRRLLAAHSVNHLPNQLEWRWHRLRIPSQDVPKVDMEQPACERLGFRV
jgi:hypothetical protein